MEKSKYGHRAINWFEAIGNKLGGEEGAERFLRGELAVVAKTITSTLLELVGFSNLPSIGKFVSSDHFTTDSKEVKIACVWNNFRNNFLSKVEEPRAKVMLRCSKLKKSSLDAPIMSELGSVAETTLASVWQMLKRQPNGDSGRLLTNGYANIFYVRDAKAVLWAVNVDWSSDGWYVDAYSVSDPFEWLVGNQVFSRNS